MYNFIKEYINKLTINDVNDFLNKQNIYLNNDELNIIYNHVINDWYNFIYINPIPILNNIKSNISIDNYNKIINLYNEYKNKFSIYL